MRPVHRDLLRSRRGDRRRAARLARRGWRPLHRDLEPGVHAVRPRARRHAESAAGAMRGYRHGSGAPRRRVAARALQLRDRPVRAPDPRGGRAHRHERSDEQVAAGDRRPHPRLRVPDRRRRAALERGPRLRAAPDHPPRPAAWLDARRARRLLLEDGAAAGRGNGRGLSRVAGKAGVRRGRAAHRGAALRRDAGTRHAPVRRGRYEVGQDHPGRRRVPPVRHLRLPGRPYRRHCTRAWARGGHGRLRAGHERTARARPRRRPLRGQGPDAGRARQPAQAHGVPRLRGVAQLRQQGARHRAWRQAGRSDWARARRDC